VRDLAWGAIGVLVGGNRGILICRQRDREVGDAIEARVIAFWRSIDDGHEPDPQYPADAGVLIKLFNKSAPARYSTAAAAGDRCADRRVSVRRRSRKQAIEDKEVAKAKVLRVIEDAERAYTDRYTISASMVKAKEISYLRPEYRNWRVTEKKA